jgi:hypothetical protein
MLRATFLFARVFRFIASWHGWLLFYPRSHARLVTSVTAAPAGHGGFEAITLAVCLP